MMHFALAVLLANGQTKPTTMVLEVGDGKPYARIEKAIAAAPEGAVIEVFARASGYEKTALLVRKRIVLRAMGAIQLDGEGFEYSGAGSVPRAIVQVEPTASGTVIEGFEIVRAGNRTANGAGVRINGANDVTIIRCDIHGNDMGVMSDAKPMLASASTPLASNQRIQNCNIHENGNLREPGFNHNLYLGGMSVSIDRCLIWGALTGHNLKSRAHFTSVTNSVLYGGSNRQIDCVDSEFTKSPNSNLLVYNCVLAMDPNSKGNGNVIHFGVETGKRDGCAYLLLSTVYTEFLTPVVLVDSIATARIDDSVIINPDPIRPALIGLAANAAASQVRGGGDWLSEGYTLASSSIAASRVGYGKVAPCDKTVPAMNSTGFELVGTQPRPVVYGYVDGSGAKHMEATPQWNIGAFPKLYESLRTQIPGTFL